MIRRFLGFLLVQKVRNTTRGVELYLSELFPIEVPQQELRGILTNAWNNFYCKFARDFTFKFNWSNKRSFLVCNEILLNTYYYLIASHMLSTTELQTEYFRADLLENSTVFICAHFRRMKIIAPINLYLTILNQTGRSKSGKITGYQVIDIRERGFRIIFLDRSGENYR